MHILISNDDGYLSQGLDELVQVALHVLLFPAKGGLLESFEELGLDGAVDRQRVKDSVQHTLAHLSRLTAALVKHLEVRRYAEFGRESAQDADDKTVQRADVQSRQVVHERSQGRDKKGWVGVTHTDPFRHGGGLRR